MFSAFCILWHVVVCHCRSPYQFYAIQLSLDLKSLYFKLVPWMTAWRIQFKCFVMFSIHFFFSYGTCLIAVMLQKLAAWKFQSIQPILAFSNENKSLSSIGSNGVYSKKLNEASTNNFKVFKNSRKSDINFWEQKTTNNFSSLI